MVREFPYGALLADIVRSLKGPADGEGTICNDLKYEQDDGILREDEIQRKPKPQKLQFFGVLTQGNGLLVNDVETALTEDMLGWLVTFDASGAGGTSVLDDGSAGAAGETVVGREGPVWADLVEI